MFAHAPGADGYVAAENAYAIAVVSEPLNSRDAILPGVGRVYGLYVELRGGGLSTC